MKAKRRKVRLNNKHPKEDASTFALTRQRRRFPFFLVGLTLSFFFFFPNYESSPSSRQPSPSPRSLFMCSLLSVASPSLYFLPRGQQFQIQTLLSLSLSVKTSNGEPAFRSC